MRNGLNGKLVLTPRKIVYFILFWTIFSDVLMAEFHLSGSIQYLNDIAWVILLYFLVKRHAINKLKRIRLRGIALSIGIFTGVCFFSSFINFVNPLLVIWASRNTFRFIIFYLATIIYLDKDDIGYIFDKLFYIQILSFFIALYQFFVLGLYMDNLGGIFGHGNGAALNTFQAMVFAYFLCGYLQKKQPFYKVAVILVSSLIVAALAEEKAFFVYLVLAIAGSLILNKPSIKTILIVGAAVFLIPEAIRLLVTINASWNLEVLTNFNRALEYMDTSYGLSRLNPFPQIQSMFFKGSIVKNLFGIGFGGAENCDATALFTSEFFGKYAYLKYYDFTHQKKFIETGILGYGSYLLLFIVNLWIMVKAKCRCSIKDFRFNYAMVFCIIAILSCWFSGALIYNDAYIIYFGLAAGLVIYKSIVMQE